MKIVRIIASALLASAIFTSPAHAIHVDATDLNVAPPDTNVVLLYYQHGENKDLYSDGKREPIDPKLTTDIGILRAVHYMRIGGLIYAPQAVMPFGSIRAGRDISALGSASGAGDLTLLFPVWFNEPGATNEFAIAPYVIVPTGQYDKNSALNLGSNRWAFDLQAGYARKVTKSIKFSLIGDVQLNGNNNDYGPSSQTLKQDPLYNLQGFLIYEFSPGTDVRFGLQHVSGGTTYVDGTSQNNRQSTSSIEFGGAYAITHTNHILLTLGRDMSVRDGFEQQSHVEVRFAHMF